MRRMMILLIVTTTLTDVAFAGYKANDTLKFWSVSYADWMAAPLPKQKEITAVCRKVGEYAYIFQDIDWVVDIPDSVLDYYSETFDSDYYKLTDLYGPVPDALDGDPRVFILVINPEWWSGYFDPIQQMPDSLTMKLWGVHSSEREIIYISARIFNKSSVPVIAHEFGHMLHWGNDHNLQTVGNSVKYWEDIWVDEGFSTFAAMYLTEGINAQDVYNANPFFRNNTELSLIHFENSDNYSSSLLFMLYMYEHFGGDNYIRTLIGNKLNGIEGIESTLGMLGYSNKFDEIFLNWTIANYLDNKDAGSGEFDYKHYNLFPCRHRQVFKQTEIEYSDSLKAYSSHYFRFGISTDSLLKVSVSGQSGYSFRAAVMLIDTSNIIPPVVKYLNAGGEITSVIVIDKKAEPYDELVISVMNSDEELGIGKFAGYTLNVDKYEYPAEVVSSSEDNIDAVLSDGQLSINLKTSQLCGAIADLFDINGNTVKSIKPGPSVSVIDMSECSMGIYILRIKSCNRVWFRKINYY